MNARAEIWYTTAGMKHAVAMLFLLSAVSLPAERLPFERDQTIVDRQMFGMPPPGFDPTRPPSEVSKSDAQASEAQLTKEQEQVKSSVHFSAITVTPSGETGVGFGNSMQKQLYLPENHTDFIFAIGAEEWGLAFSLLLLALFVTVFVCGVIIAAKSQDRLGKLMAYGMVFLIFFQALFNMGVVTGLLPTKGLALPFISYGGTNLMSALIAIGVLINISRQTDLQREREKSKISAVFHIKGE